jgi:hypothetical protein
MTRGDRLIEKGSTRLRDLSRKAAERGGVAEKLAQPLAEDAEFLRKLKPSLIAARARGAAPTGEAPRAVPAPEASRSGRPKPKGTGPNPFVVIGVALAVGVFLAKMIDWRSHAHPND